jgi:hypothetical protein
MGHKDTTTKTQKTTPGQTGKDWTQGHGSQNMGQGQYRGQGQPMNQDQGAWNDRAQREVQPGDETRPAQPSGTSPLDQDQRPVNQHRPVQQNR